MRDPLAKTLRIGMVSTYPPTQCGLATFSSALERALAVYGHRVDVVRVDDGAAPEPAGSSVGAVLMPGSAASLRRSAALLNACDVAVVQHEYGIYGGEDGDEVLELIREVDRPLVVVLHTVPQQASGHQTEILIDLCQRADAVVVMSEAARDRLVRTYFPIDDSKVVTIPHGAELADHVRRGVASPPARDGDLVTWGLLGPGKGIEHVIDAIALLNDLGQPVRYTVAGATHPKVREREGDAYRDALMARARQRGVANLVTFDDAYRGVRELTEYLTGFATVVLPYASTEQVTSGVLVDSIAAGRAVISTPFPHAQELLGRGGGVLVPHGDHRTLAVAIRTLTSEPDRLARLQAASRTLAPTLSWQAVASGYLALIESLVAERTRMSA